MATIAVNGDGVVGVVVRPPQLSGQERLYAALRGIAGRRITFTPSVPVSTVPNKMSAQTRSDFHPNGGDTAGLIAAADGRFHAIWIDNRTGFQQVWAARLSFAVARRGVPNDQAPEL